MDFEPHVELVRALYTSASLESARSLAIVESRLRRGDSTPVHVHEAPEAFHALEGMLAVFVGGEELELAPGESVVAPRAVPHAVRAPHGPARYLSGSLVRSAARYEDFLRAVAPPLPDAAAWTEGEDAFRLSALGAVNGISLVGAPGELPVVAAQAA